MAIYFASDNTADGSRDGSSGHPYLDPSELPTPWRMQSGTEYLFRCDTETNFLNAFRSVDDPAAEIVVGSWGSGAKPIITAYRMLDRSECLEVTVNTSGTLAVLTLAPGSGSNLWRVPKTFFGLFAGNVWGGCTDIGGRVGDHSNKVVPAAAREWCGSVSNHSIYGVTGGYAVVYSEGNPVDVYGGLLVSSFDETDWDSGAAYKTTFYTLRARGGFELAGLDLRSMYHASLSQVGYTAAVADLGPHTFTELNLRETYRGVTVNGALADPSYPSPGIRFSRLRVNDNYAENLGNQFFDTSGNIGTCLNDARIYKNVVNGFARAYSTAGIYLPGTLTSDGSRIRVYANTICNGDEGHYWPIDGAALMVEEDGSDVEFARNVLWNNKRNVNFNGIGATLPSTNIVASNNVIVAPAVTPAESCTAFQANSNTLAVEVALYGNVTIGFVRFVDYNSHASTHLTVSGNISLGSGPIAGSGNGSLYEAIRSETADTALLTIDRNNFYGHYADLRTWAGTTYNSAPEVNNRITSDPSSEIARLPVMNDPTVNYALQIRTGARIKAGGVVDLRPGTRVVV